ncbi:PP2C-family Ser/Thr phosphatase [Actinomycetota bacterium]|nr:PP2C-family Ser/Thr phosphatase [Actinomycetota bacterium]
MKKIDNDSREDLYLKYDPHEIDQEILENVRHNLILLAWEPTLTALSIFDKHIELLPIGDSRCYRYRDNKLEQLSYDHTVMQELLDQGRLTTQEVFDPPAAFFVNSGAHGRFWIRSNFDQF